MGQDSLIMFQFFSNPFFHLKFLHHLGRKGGRKEGKKERKKEREGGRKKAGRKRKKQRKGRKNELSWVYSSGLIILC